MTTLTLNDLPKPISAKSGWPWTEGTPSLPNLMPSGQPWPKVSIVTPSYNQAEFIEETIRSVLLQGYPNLEYVVIDGGSTDGSVDIIRKYEPWLSYWVSESDSGQSEAINKGLARATGYIMSWLNSDDRYQPGALQAGIIVLNEQPEAGVVYGDYTEIDKDSNLIDIYQSPDFDIRRQMITQLIAQPAAFFRREVWETIGPLRTEFHYVMDRDLWNRAALRYPIVHFSALIADMRMHLASKTVGQTVKFMHELENYYSDFFALPDLPANLKVLKQEARGANFFGMGREYFLDKQFEKASNAFKQAWQCYPFNINKLMILPFWVDSHLRRDTVSTSLFRLGTWLKQGIWLKPD